MEVSVHYAKTNLSRLLKLAVEGEMVTIVRRGLPLVQLTPVLHTGTRQLGWDAAGSVPEDLLRPLTDPEADAFLRGE